MQSYVGDLRSSLIQILQGTYSSSLLTRFINDCHKMAISYLRMKSKTTSFQTARFGLDLSDFAYDAIADLFKRDMNGCLLVFQAYFKSIISLEEKTDDQLHNELRRLIFSSVNQRIILSYRENDPGLAKLIRNIKLALKNHSGACFLEHRGEQLISRAESRKQNESLSEIPPELLEIEFRLEAAGTNSLKDLLSVLVNVLDRQDNYRKTYSLTGTAILLRSFYFSDYKDNEERDEERAISEEDLRIVIGESVTRVIAKQGKEYLEKGKLNEAEFELLQWVLKDILQAEYGNSSDIGRSYFEMLKVYEPNISKARYREKYRHIIEYLVKTTREEMIRLMKRELNITR